MPPVIVTGYHGTTEDAARAILVNGFLPSRQRWDWLGDGVYFFQDAPARAWEWARQRHGERAAVLAATLELADCIDLLDIPWMSSLQAFYALWERLQFLAGHVLPRQQQGSGFRPVDRALINHAVEQMALVGTRIRTVRGAFHEGSSLFPGSGIFDRAHVQIAVRDVALIQNTRLANE